MSDDRQRQVRRLVLSSDVLIAMLLLDMVVLLQLVLLLVLNISEVEKL